MPQWEAEMEPRWPREPASQARRPTWRAKGTQEAKPSKFAERYAIFGARAPGQQASGWVPALGGEVGMYINMEY